MENRSFVIPQKLQIGIEKEGFGEIVHPLIQLLLSFQKRVQDISQNNDLKGGDRDEISRN